MCLSDDVVGRRRSGAGGGLVAATVLTTNVRGETGGVRYRVAH